MNYTKSLFITIIFISCNYFKTSTSRYDRTVNRIANDEISINSNGTFNYKWRYGLYSGETSGIWDLKKNYYILNSFKSPKKTVTLKTIPNLEDSITLSLIDQDSIPLTSAIVTINDTISLVSNIEGFVTMPISEVEDITVKYLDYDPCRILLKSKEFNFIRLQCHINYSYYKYFNNDTAIIMKNRLILINDPLHEKLPALYTKHP